MPKKYMTVLTIAGSDSSGGAGIQADLKTFSALRCYGMSAITALTAQNTCGVQAIHAIPGEFVQAQIESVTSDIAVDAIKIGMLDREEIILAVCDAIKNLTCPIVLDPVMFAKGGSRLLTLEAIAVMCDQLFPLSTLVTPNIPEAEYITHMKINTIDDMQSAAIKISERGAKNVLIKGGHRLDEKCIDVLYQSENALFTFYPSKRIHTHNTHGTGCTLSAAIAAELAKKKDLNRAVACAKKFLLKAIVSGKKFTLGQGHGPVNHLFH